MDGSEYLAPMNSLKFAQATLVVGFRRDAVDTNLRFIFAVPRSPVLTTNANFNIAIGTIGGASTYYTYGSNTSSVTSNEGGLLGRNTVASMRTTDGAMNMFVNPVSGAQPFVRDHTDLAVITHTALNVQPRFGCDGNGGQNFLGRVSGLVMTNRAESDAFRFRIVRELADAIGMEV